MTNKDILAKIDSGEKFTESEISELVFEFDEVEREKGDGGRWTQSITSYIRIGERYLCVEWDRGLTEMQEDEFYYQPYEVERKTYQKIIPEHIVEIAEWVKKII